MHEFELIKKYFVPLTEGRPEAQGLKNDAAIFSCKDDEELVISSDNLIEGVHFFHGMPAQEVAQRALRVNVSDLVAMGAEPYFYQLSITFNDTPKEKWIADFCDALRQEHKSLGIFCSGGNTTKGQCPLNIAISVVGKLPKGSALPRSGAKPGDTLCVSGFIGDAHLGLLTRQGQLSSSYDDYFSAAYIPPLPFVEGVSLLRKYAKAAIDISDGLLADLNHLCEESKCGVDIDLDADLYSPQALELLKAGKISHNDLLSGGDDYELLLAIAEDNLMPFIHAAKVLGRNIAPIGKFKDDLTITGYDHAGKQYSFEKLGWTHF